MTFTRTYANVFDEDILEKIKKDIKELEEDLFSRRQWIDNDIMYDATTRIQTLKGLMQFIQIRV